MSFLNPGILYLLLLGSIPPLIHLISKRKKEVLKFSSINFFKEMEDSRIKKLKIKQMLLLLVRILIIIFLVLGFARPTLKGSFSSIVGHEKATTGFIILDNSLSTNTYFRGKKVFQVLKQRTGQIFSLINNYDEFYLCFLDKYDSSVRIEPLKKPEYNQFILDQIAPTNFKGQLPETFNKISEMLKQDYNVNNEIYLLSDMQSSEFIGVNFDEIEEAHIFNISLTESIDNCGLQSIELENQIFESGKDINISATLGTFTENENGEVLLSLFLNGKRVAQRNIKTEPYKIFNENFKINIDEKGYVKGYFELEDDALEEDNRRYFSFSIPEKIKILIVNENNPNPYLDAVLSSNNLYEITDVPFPELSKTELSNYDIIILNELTYKYQIPVLKIKEYIESTGNLIIITGTVTSRNYFNNGIANHLNLPRLIDIVRLNRDYNEFVTFSDINFAHVILKNLVGNNEFSYPKFYNFPLFQNSSGSNNIISLSSGSPFLSEQEYKGHKILVLSAGINDIDSDFPFTGIFAPFLYRIILYMGSEFQSVEKDKITGKELNYSFDEYKNDFALKHPSGESTIISPKSLKDRFLLKFIPSEMGFYTIYTNDKDEKHLFVNFDANESNLKQITKRRLETTFSKSNLHFINIDDNIIDNIKRIRYGSEISTLMFIFVFVLIIFEVILEWEKF